MKFEVKKALMKKGSLIIRLEPETAEDRETIDSVLEGDSSTAYILTGDRHRVDIVLRRGVKK